MQKNFIQKHALFVGVIAFCFMFIPFIKEVYGFDKKSPQPKVTIVTPNDKKDVQADIKKRVVLDAGHGGYDAGSISTTGIEEKDVTLAIAKKVGTILQKADVAVIYTRNSDKVSWPSDNVKDLLMRSEIANASGADYFVSIHANFSEVSQNQVSGSEVWVRHDQGENDRFAYFVDTAMAKVSGMKSRGIKDEATSPLSLLHYNHMPSILIETGFLSNAHDTKILSSKKGQDAIAHAIAQGILDTLNEKTK